MLSFGGYVSAERFCYSAELLQCSGSDQTKHLHTRQRSAGRHEEHGTLLKVYGKKWCSSNYNCRITTRQCFQPAVLGGDTKYDWNKTRHGLCPTALELV